VDHLAQGDGDIRQLKRLANEVKSAGTNKLLMGVAADIAAHVTATNIRIDLTETGQRAWTVHFGHTHIQENNINLAPVLSIDGNCLLAISGDADIKTMMPQANLKKGANAGLVIHDKN
jgi:hypothetical protein